MAERKRKAHEQTTLKNHLSPSSTNKNGEEEVKKKETIESDDPSSDEGGDEAVCVAVRLATTDEASGDVKVRSQNLPPDDVTAQSFRRDLTYTLVMNALSPLFVELKLDDKLFSVERVYKKRRHDRSPSLALDDLVPESAAVSEQICSCSNIAEEPSSLQLNQKSVRTGVHRCVVSSIEASTVQQRYRTILVNLCETKEKVVVELHDSWITTTLVIGDILHLIAPLTERDGTLHACISRQDGFLILFPDVLVSGSQVPVGNSCLRKAYISDRIADRKPLHHSAVMGNIMHKIMQDCLKKYVPYNGEIVDMSKELEEELRSLGIALFECDKTEADAQTYVTERLVHLQEWLQHFASKEKGSASVLEVMDIEECIWAPQYGLKGRVDASLSIRSSHEDSGTTRHSSTVGASVYSGRYTLQSRQKHINRKDGNLCPAGSQSSKETTVVPLEFKTGKPYFTHKAQVLLYLLLMETRYNTEITEGLLWYVDRPKEAEMVTMKKSEMDSLIMARNDFATYLAHSLTMLPPMLMNQRSCQRCFVRETCAVLHKALENGDEKSAGMGPEFVSLTEHVEQLHVQFLNRWLFASDYANTEPQAKLPYTWHPEEAQCQKAGVPGVRDLKLQNVRREDTDYIYTFTGAQGQETFCKDDFVVVSIEDDQPAILKGFIRETGQDLVTVGTDVLLPDRWHRPEYRWRLNKYYTSRSAVLQRGNIMELLSSREPSVVTLRELVVDLRQPTLCTDPQSNEHTISHNNEKLNDDQNKAIERILQRPEYCLIHGMPGSGKTTTIAHAIKALVDLGYSVLVSSYTHSAVDNILVRLKVLNVEFIRIGQEKSVHNDVNDHILGGDNKFWDTSTTALKQLQDKIKVVGVTCMGIHHGFLKRLRYDVCVIDEACQIVLPSLLGPLLLARSFVLVGDPMQLPPIVASPEARKLGMEETLFSILQQSHPQTVIPLSYQYRMSREIMELANHTVYDNKLRCGNEEIAQQKLSLPHYSANNEEYPAFRSILDPSVGLVFLDTSPLIWSDTKQGDSFFNRKESKLTVQLAMALCSYGLSEKDIGVVSPYNSQISAIRASLQEQGLEVEASTVDKFQGRDKQCVIISFVRSNVKTETGALIADWRRVNVAITRARSKLIIIGNTRTLRANAFVAKAIDFIQNKNGIVQLVI